MNQSNSALKKDFPQQPNFTTLHHSFFDGMLAFCRGELTETMGRSISDYALNYVRRHSINLHNSNPENYVRTYIGRDTATNWESIIMSWCKGNKTSIHAHPKYACYTFSEGEFLIEVFEKVHGSAKVILKESVTINKPTSLYSIGTEEGYGNHIHRITCLSETGCSLHVYSDNALKGLKYEL